MFAKSHLPFPISHFPISFFTSFPCPGPAECAERLNPPPLPYGKRWRVRSKAQVRNCKSQICRSLTPLKSPPSAPAHSARPTQIDRGPGFYDFQKTLASAERGAKKLCRVDIDVNLCQKCKLQDTTFIIFMFQLTFRITFFQKSASRLSGEHIFEKQLQALSIIFFTFFPPKRPQKEHFFPLSSLFSLFWPFRSLFFRFLSPLEF